MRILLVSSIYPPTIGGPAPHTQQIAREWARLGHSVEVCVPQQEKPITAETGFTLTVMQGRKCSGLSGKLTRWLGCLGILHHALRARRPDFCVMMVFGGTLAFLTGLLCRWHGVPALIKLTGERAFESALEQQALKGTVAAGAHAAQRPGWRDVLLTRVFKAVWATSPFFAERLERDYRLDASRILRLPNFIDLSRFANMGRSGRATAPFLLITVCRLRPWKGIETCLRAAARLRDIPFHWSFVGSGPAAYLKTLEALVKELGLEDRVSFRGETAPDGMREHYAVADLFVLLSDYEPFGIVLVEAMAAGVPIVATETGGIPSVTDGSRCARLVRPGQPEQAAEAIRNLLLDAGARQALAQAGFQRAPEFSVQAGCARLESFGHSLARSSLFRIEDLRGNAGPTQSRTRPSTIA